MVEIALAVVRQFLLFAALLTPLELLRPAHRDQKPVRAGTLTDLLYFTQLLGVALGVSPRKLGVHENVSDGIEVLKEKQIV